MNERGNQLATIFIYVKTKKEKLIKKCESDALTTAIKDVHVLFSSVCIFVIIVQQILMG